ncbi:MAG TPA: hypothetical protein VIL46_08850 [Gemmataceae bacterium]
MATVPARRLSRRAMLLLAPALAAGAGCHLLGKTGFFAQKFAAELHAERVVATWDNRVHYAPDPVRGGAPTPGLTGRLYLFGGETAEPLCRDGGLTVELYDHTPRSGAAGPKLLEKWIIDPVTLKQFRQKDPLGLDCFFVFLPWGTYSPDVKRVYLAATFEPFDGPPLRTPGSVLSIDHSASAENGLWQAAGTRPAEAAPGTSSAPSTPSVPSTPLPDPRELPAE